MVLARPGPDVANWIRARRGRTNAGQTWFWCGRLWPDPGQLRQYGANNNVGHALTDPGHMWPDVGHMIMLPNLPDVAGCCQIWPGPGPDVQCCLGTLLNSHFHINDTFVFISSPLFCFNSWEIILLLIYLCISMIYVLILYVLRIISLSSCPYHRSFGLFANHNNNY